MITYITFSVYKLVYVLFCPSTNKSAYLYGTIALVNCFISYGTYRKNMIACWIMIIFLSLTGVGGLLLGVLMVPLSEIVLKVVFIVLGPILCLDHTSSISIGLRTVNRNEIKQCQCKT